MGEKTRVAVEVLRTVSYSEDGLTSRELVAGSSDQIEESSFAGLAAEGYVRAAEGQKAMPAAPENKALGAAPENKAPSPPKPQHQPRKPAK